MRVPKDAFNEHYVGGYALNAAICGTTSDCVLRFLAANTSIVSPEGYITVTDSATLGTQVNLLRRGKYYAAFGVVVNPHADSTLVMGIGKDVAAAVGQTNPVYNAAFANGILPGSITRLDNPAAAALTLSARCEAYFDVNDAEAGAGCVITFHCGDANGTPTANAITAASETHGFVVAQYSEKVG